MSGLAARLRRHHRQRTLGQSFVEFALILPIFLLFLAATIDLGRVFYANITLNNAAREGAFQASLTPDEYLAGQPCSAANSVVCRIQNETAGSMIAIQPDDIDLSCSLASCPESAGSTVTVTVSGTFRLLTPLLSIVFGGQNLQLTSSAVAQIEYFDFGAVATPPPAPDAEFAGTPRTILPGESVTFDSSLSTGDPTGFQWDLDGDGIVDTTDPNPTWTYPTEGQFMVTLTVVNMSGVDIEVKSNYVTVSAAGPSESSSTEPSESTGPTCVFPPNVVGMTLSNGQITLQGAGFNNQKLTAITSGTKGRIQGQNPDHTECLDLDTEIELVYRPST